MSVKEVGGLVTGFSVCSFIIKNSPCHFFLIHSSVIIARAPCIQYLLVYIALSYSLIPLLSLRLVFYFYHAELSAFLPSLFSLPHSVLSLFFLFVSSAVSFLQPALVFVLLFTNIFKEICHSL